MPFSSSSSAPLDRLSVVYNRASAVTIAAAKVEHRTDSIELSSLEIQLKCLPLILGNNKSYTTVTVNAKLCNCRGVLECSCLTHQLDRCKVILCTPVSVLEVACSSPECKSMALLSCSHDQALSCWWLLLCA